MVLDFLDIYVILVPNSVRWLADVIAHYKPLFHTGQLQCPIWTARAHQTR